MSTPTEITCMFMDMCYKQHIPELLEQQPQMLQKALSVQADVAKVVVWECDTFSSLDSDYDLRADPLFSRLIQITAERVGQFASMYGVAENCTIVCKDAWVNVAGPGAFQEMHIHPSSHFSAVYYVEAPEDCGNLFFRSHESVADMFPLPTDTQMPANNKTYWHKPQTGTLIIFRSNLPHMVAKNNSGAARVSVAMNFTVARA